MSLDIAVMVPSRGRPNNIRELFNAWASTITSPSRAILQVYIDADDPEMPGYREVAVEMSERPLNFLWSFAICKERMRLGGTLNAAAPVLASFYNVVGFMGDDHRPRTVDWDKKVAEYFMDSVNGVLYGDDLIQRRNLPTAVFMDSRIINALGYFIIPGQIHLWMDNFWKRIGEELGTLTYRDDLIFEHLHPIANKAAWDAGYVEANDGGVSEHDRLIYEDWVANEMEAAVAKVRNL